MSETFDFTMHSGDNVLLEVTLLDENDAVVPLSGAAIDWALAKRKGKSGFSHSVLASKSLGSGITIIDAPSGRFDIGVGPADTDGLKGDFYYETQVLDSAGRVSTVLVGTITVVEDLIV